MNQQLRPIVQHKKHEAFVAKSNISFWYKNHFYYYLAGESITSAVALREIRKNKQLSYQLMPAR